MKVILKSIETVKITEVQLKAFRVIIGCKWFTLGTMNLLFRMLDIPLIPHKIITWLLEKGMLVKHKGIYDLYYNATDEFVTLILNEGYEIQLIRVPEVS